MSSHATLQQQAIALKGGMFTLTTIQILDTDLEELSAQLEDKIKQAPNFFQNAPIVIDLQRIDENESFDLYSLIKFVKLKNLIPIGIRGASITLKEEALRMGLAIFPEEKVISSNKSTDKENKPKNEPTTEISSFQRNTTSKLILQPVRSGQQIYAQGGDLVVLAPVSNGAELLADGHIHVYASMRGRALAGVMGNQEAMIFCRSLEAELISIAGQYLLSEQLKENWKQSVCIQLTDERLHIRSV